VAEQKTATSAGNDWKKFNHSGRGGSPYEERGLHDG
jgi:hypothetical protein